MVSCLLLLLLDKKNNTAENYALFQDYIQNQARIQREQFECIYQK